MRSINGKTARALGPAILAATGVMAGALALNATMKLAQTTPHAGDIVAFSPSRSTPAGEGVRLLVHRRDQFGCVLDLNVLRHTGGSLVVETRPGTGTGDFRVHWAGLRTSGDPGNCGGDADLIVSRRDLDILKLSAGSHGFDPAPMRLLAGN